MTLRLHHVGALPRPALALLLGTAPVAVAGDAGSWPSDLPDIVAPLMAAVVNISILKQRPTAARRAA